MIEPMRPLLAIAAIPLIGVCVGMSACTTLGYYAQAAGGHLKLMRAREPIADLLADESLDDGLRHRLETLLEAREFAVSALALPDTDSYRTYVETGRRAVTWNVVAAEEFSVRPYIWCFPIAGCVSYRGYYAEADAREYADEFRRQGYDVSIGGASAYSTLGWFDDPVLDTMLRGPDTRYVGTLFHEMAHQLLYVSDDSSFNEAYASFVEEAGVRQWLRSRGEQERIDAYDESLRRAADFTALLAETRNELLAVYESGDDSETMRDGKRAAFEQMRARYETLKNGSWGGYAGYDGWFRRELNNARLVAVSTYRRLIPAFTVLFEDVGQDMPRFHAAAEQIAELPSAERRARMDALLARAAGE